MLVKRTAVHAEGDAAQLAQYAATRGASLREAIVLRYVPLVHFVLNRLGFSQTIGADYEDLASHGLLGLIEAVDRFDPAYGAQFSTYATLRIRGTVLDQLRARDWLSRAARKRAREVQNAVSSLWLTLNRAPTDEELATHLNLGLDQLRQALTESDRVLLSLDAVSDAHDEDTSLHEVLADPKQADPAEAMLDLDLHARLVNALKVLPEREQVVLSMYYYDDLTLKEIGEVLSLSESRVCQLHARAVMNLHALLNEEEVMVIKTTAQRMRRNGRR
ncbi:MAG: sigma-70 family RNA polymerase sigma factor [Anaerolineales bacterium]